MKIRQHLERYQFLFSALFFAAWMWSSLREKAVGEAVLYSVALAASLFLAVLALSGWGVPKKPLAEDVPEDAPRVDTGK